MLTGPILSLRTPVAHELRCPAQVRLAKAKYGAPWPTGILKGGKGGREVFKIDLRVGAGFQRPVADFSSEFGEQSGTAPINQQILGFLAPKRVGREGREGF